MPSNPSNKRKEPPISNSRSSAGNARSQKRQKTASARAILTQPADQAINERGELDVGAFVKAREFEIAALEQGIKSAKHGLSQRAFQQVPRQLRRRTASHNVKKIPRRLRRRAEREIKEDNTPTGSERKKDLNSKRRVRREVAKRAAKDGNRAREQRERLAAAQEDGNKKSEAEAKDLGRGEQASALLNKGSEAPAAIRPVNPPHARKNELTSEPGPVSKFRKRQKDKTWLPTHVFHAKRAQMTPPAKPLWRFAMPLSPTERAYRITHRAANLRGCIAWDASYMSTVQLKGAESSLLGTLRALGVPEAMLTRSHGEGWREGSKSWKGWARHRDKPEAWIAPIDILWCPGERVKSSIPAGSHSTEKEGMKFNQKRKLLIQVHPAGFLDLWNELLKLAKMQRPQATVQDLRFDIGRIELQGPAATEALAAILRPIGPHDQDPFTRQASKILKTLGSVVTPGAMGSNLVLSTCISDPRLHHPPNRLDTSDITSDDVLQLQQNWPAADINSAEGSLFDPLARFASCRLQASQKAINRRKRGANLGITPKPLPSDPRIPILICSTPTSTTSPSSPFSGPRHESWTLMMPWHWVLPIWTSLMYLPLSCGGTPRFGGLDEKRQLAFERGEATFPMDFPGTAAGVAWEREASAQRREEWERRPRGKRTEWSSVDLGQLGGTQHKQRLLKGEVFDGLKCDWSPLLAQDKPGIRDHFPSEETGMTSRTMEAPSATKLCQVLPAQLRAAQTTQTESTSAEKANFIPGRTALVTVKIRYIQRGVPATCARIYRLPRTNTELRNRWMALLKDDDAAIGDKKSSRARQLPTTKKSIAQEKKTAASTKAVTDKKSALSSAAAGGTAELSKGKTSNVDNERKDAKSNETHDNDDDKEDNFSYPPVPDVDDLIGYVTTGNFNLAEGSGTAIGSIALAKVWGTEGGGGWDRASEPRSEDEDTEPENGTPGEKEGKSGMGRWQGICIVRNSGARMGRLAKWTIV